MPTRLTAAMPPPAPAGAEATSAHTAPYCSPGAASLGTLMVTVAFTLPFAGMSGLVGLTEVHVDRSFLVCPAAPRKALSVMVAAAGYRATWAVLAVVLVTSIRRLMVVPGAR